MNDYTPEQRQQAEDRLRARGIEPPMIDDLPEQLRYFGAQAGGKYGNDLYRAVVLALEITILQRDEALAARDLMLIAMKQERDAARGEIAGARRGEELAQSLARQMQDERDTAQQQAKEPAVANYQGGDELITVSVPVPLYILNYLAALQTCAPTREERGYGVRSSLAAGIEVYFGTAARVWATEEAEAGKH